MLVIGSLLGSVGGVILWILLCDTLGSDWYDTLGLWVFPAAICGLLVALSRAGFLFVLGSVSASMVLVMTMRLDATLLLLITGIKPTSNPEVSSLDLLYTFIGFASLGGISMIVTAQHFTRRPIK